MIWTVPAIIAAMRAWLGQGGPGRGTAFGALLLGHLPSWYLWAVATPAVLYLARRWTPTATSYRWIAPHLAVATAFAVFRIAFGFLYGLPLNSLPITAATITARLREGLPSDFMFSLFIYGVVLSFATAALREHDSAAEPDAE